MRLKMDLLIPLRSCEQGPLGCVGTMASKCLLPLPMMGDIQSRMNLNFTHEKE